MKFSGLKHSLIRGTNQYGKVNDTSEDYDAYPTIPFIDEYNVTLITVKLTKHIQDKQDNEVLSFAY